MNTHYTIGNDNTVYIESNYTGIPMEILMYEVGIGFFGSGQVAHSRLDDVIAWYEKNPGYDRRVLNAFKEAKRKFDEGMITEFD